MISFIGNRPAIQVGRHQVVDYDVAWLDEAIRRAARAAEIENFPFVEDIRGGVEKYLETKCPLRMMNLDELFDRLRQMLEKIGCAHIAEKLETTAPPLTFSLVRAAMEAGNGFELAFFEALRSELRELRSAGASEIRFTGLREASLILRGTSKWNKACDTIHAEIEAFLKAWDRDADAALPCVPSGG